MYINGCCIQGMHMEFTIKSDLSLLLILMPGWRSEITDLQDRFLPHHYSSGIANS
jgi:hypothetical protein